ncbi:hypothetical protein ACIBQ1_09740 [Nonomuraea sp. NPDC050153]|uniref:hypothetical protein n=1 Tax=Nonomuraea sp. NPDC050153 TaxID=3364359 RepID=UPI0037B8B4AC
MPDDLRHRCDNCEGIDPDSCLMRDPKDDLRQRYAEAILARLRQTAGPTPSDDDLADAVLAVRDKDLESLRALLARVRDQAEQWAATPPGRDIATYSGVGRELLKALAALNDTEGPERDG